VKFLPKKPTIKRNKKVDKKLSNKGTFSRRG
jgi:hypothetical protein